MQEGLLTFCTICLVLRVSSYGLQELFVVFMFMQTPNILQTWQMLMVDYWRLDNRHTCNCFIFECVNPKQTLWLLLIGCDLMLHVCMQLSFWTQILKAFARVLKKRAFYHHFHVCMFWMNIVDTRKLNCEHVVLMCELWVCMCKCYILCYINKQLQYTITLCPCKEGWVPS
jgi:hypothetical protein